jgi:tubulin-folding cofactor B
VSSDNAKSERRFLKSITVLTLKEKLEAITGIPASSMSLQLYNSLKENISMENSKMLGYYSPQDYDTLIVSCTSKERFVNYNDVSSVEKFEMSQEDYEARTGSVLEFKKRNKIGRFSDSASLASKDYTPEQELLEKIKIGDRCITSDDIKKGTVMYVGNVDFKEGPWVGIALDEPLGKHDGRYFKKVIL